MMTREQMIKKHEKYYRGQSKLLIRDIICEIYYDFENKIKTKLSEVDIPLEKFKEIDLIIREEIEK